MSSSSSRDHRSGPTRASVLGTTQTKRVRLTHEQRAAQLLDVAAQLFTTHGYECVSIEDIARAAGVTRPVIYQHFGSKDGIYLACVQQVSVEFMEQLAGASETAGGDLEVFLERGTGVLFDLLVEHPGSWGLLFGTTLTEAGPLAERLAELRFEAIDRIGLLASEFVDGADQDALDAFANAVAGVADSFGRWWLRRPDLARDDIERFFRVFIRGAMVSAAHATAVPGARPARGVARVGRNAR